MKKMIILPCIILCLWSCATPKEIAKNETEASLKTEPVIEGKEKQDAQIINYQTDEKLWLWVHPNKGPDEFREDREVCRPTQDVIDTFLNDDEKAFLGWMMPHAAYNKCMFSKGWDIKIERKDSATKQQRDLQ